MSEARNSPEVVVSSVQSSHAQMPQLQSSTATWALLNGEAVPFLIDSYKGGTPKKATFSGNHMENILGTMVTVSSGFRQCFLTQTVTYVDKTPKVFTADY
ncbi:hypothetical protein HPG69_004334 [Diceros bicornis minor]|uniref:Uncharacterized protein n=1 Tax=Diceros bicornis minor TaxID=77932 RepID=A0A7J7F4P1_DICBM|nr:hypothetical protein HPG69_004334 [Diceros bicornis minor]